MSASARTKHALATTLVVVLTGSGLAGAAPAQAATANPAPPARLAVATSTTVLTLSETTVQYGAPVTVTAKVTTSSGTPAGDVTFVIDDVAAKVTVVNGAASLLIKQPVRGSRTVSATFTPSDTIGYTGSSAVPASFKVVKADTASHIWLGGKQAGTRTSAHVRVRGAFDTVPTGRVKLILRDASKRGTLETRWGRLTRGKRGFNLGQLGQGRYSIVAKYLGDGSHRRSGVVKRFRVLS